MPPWNLPWSTFGAFVVLLLTIVLALGWAAWDRARERDGAHDGASDEEAGR